MEPISAPASSMLSFAQNWLHSYPPATEPTTTKPYDPEAETPRARFIPQIHPREAKVSAEVNGYFLRHWPFPNEKSKKKFVAAGFSRVTCYYYPAALDDRIAFACRLLTLLFLIDDLLEHMSLQDGSDYNERLILISKNEAAPDPDIPVEWITHHLWRDMRACDRELADDILEPVFIFMRAQTDKSRLSIKELGQYLEYREKDVGQALLSALMRFSMKLHLDPQDLESVSNLEMNCSKHISVINDIYSWEKELKALEKGHPEGSAVCSAVSVLSSEASLSYAASKRVLWTMCREWELVHEELAKKRMQSSPGCSESVKSFIKGLEYQMSGNEAWSKSTPRYNQI
ncbi:hypothetical protein F66182_794 [Fusarium sp. NRRL 66182]|nr:hypothetical protein F66182_794 [Fusarium sp. NRRL 66182]